MSALKFIPAAADPRALLERDRMLAAFLRRCITGLEADGSAAVERALADVLDTLLTEFEEKHERAADMNCDYFTGQIDTLGWVLRCVAAGAFSQHPSFEDDFRPTTEPRSTNTMEARS
ncbi:hypothetical protein AB0M39_21635 [Streptomyces sp. NPDC051907]|uniref:hypothetical protein n=1 Tax=Streptomyces sp. NPDC051907 TaxID=3155284 RepID=UPI0034161FC5